MRLTLSLSLLILAVCLFGTQAKAAQNAPLLWRIEGSPPSYLFGSIHSANPTLNALPPAVDRAFGQSHAFYGELSLDPTTLMEAGRAFQLPEGQRLSERLAPATQERLNRVLARISPTLSLSVLDRLRLWALTTTLVVLDEKIRYDNAPIMDQRLYERALQAGKQTGALETVSEQAGVFEALDWDEQLQLLEATLAYIEQAQAQDRPLLAETYRVYQAGDPEAFLDLLDEQMEVPLLLKLKLRRRLIDERNRRMAERIQGLLKTAPHTPFFFTIGAAHFAGHQGVQRLLRERGFSVERVKAQAFSRSE
ncbi:TraB/GumN family protein [Motiliproteus sp. SC1-56]|uniref:TraB/GumN family protein n=1 Tax=Motiliproteus sp. SC1-56 TaxID=2799565 RepID=UPI001A8C950C|nr:TraB/GumN family protein [Motiliproteus sp. SC1-56]